MYEALVDSVIPNKKKKLSSTVSKPPEASEAVGQPTSPKESTVNINQIKALTNPTTSDQNKQQDTLPPNFELIPFETDDDDMLMKYLDTTEFDTEPHPQCTKWQNYDDPPNDTINSDDSHNV